MPCRRRVGCDSGSGVVPVDQVSTAALAAEVEELGLPADRFLLGIGSGGAPHPVPLLRLAVDELKASCSVPIAVGALGPRVRRLAAEAADGIVLSWLTPEAARQARTDASAAAAEVARAAPRLVLYARTAVVAAARGALEEEAARYESYPAYRAHFERSGYRAMDAVIYATSPEDLGARISQYDEAVDELVARAITTDDSVAGIRAVVDAIAIS